MSETTVSSSDPKSPAPKSSRGKRIRRILRILAIVVILLLLGVYLFRNPLVRHSVIFGGKYATNLETNLDSANLSLVGGSLALNSLDMANVAGGKYKEPKILTMKSCSASVKPTSLLTDTIQVNDITIDGLEVTLEQNGLNNNLNDLLDTIKSKSPAAGDNTKSSPGKNLKIGTLKLTGTKVHIRGLMSLDLNLPDLEIQDPMNPDGRPMKIADLISSVVVRLTQQIVENPAIPGGIKDGMKNAAAIVNNLKDQLGKGVKDLTNSPVFQDTGKNLQNAGKNIQNLFNNKKDSK
ncbi:MAG: AsmA family protein [Phycisphaerales bacterium]|nr:AsmA family protein [Phycisphaerales bacterium]